jgi:hypothetical protein
MIDGRFAKPAALAQYIISPLADYRGVKNIKSTWAFQANSIVIGRA